MIKSFILSLGLITTVVLGLLITKVNAQSPSPSASPSETMSPSPSPMSPTGAPNTGAGGLTVQR